MSADEAARLAVVGWQIGWASATGNARRRPVAEGRQTKPMRWVNGSECLGGAVSTASGLIFIAWVAR